MYKWLKKLMSSPGESINNNNKGKTYLIHSLDLVFPRLLFVACDGGEFVLPRHPASLVFVHGIDGPLHLVLVVLPRTLTRRPETNTLHRETVKKITYVVSGVMLNQYSMVD
jgi:hypothetical protein